MPTMAMSAWLFPTGTAYTWWALKLTRMEHQTWWIEPTILGWRYIINWSKLIVVVVLAPELGMKSFWIRFWLSRIICLMIFFVPWMNEFCAFTCQSVDLSCRSSFIHHHLWIIQGWPYEFLSLVYGTDLHVSNKGSIGEPPMGSRHSPFRCLLVLVNFGFLHSVCAPVISTHYQLEAELPAGKRHWYLGIGISNYKVFPP